MRSSLIGKIEKARIYAQEPERICVASFSCRVRGDHGSHTVTLAEGRLRCDCYFFADHDTCSHTMAMQRIMHDLLPEELRQAHPAA